MTAPEKPDRDVLETDGAVRHRGLLDAKALDAIEALIDSVHPETAGTRLRHLGPAADLFMPDGAVGRLACTALNARAFPVRALLFDKSAANNWALGWHQDRTIAVARRVAISGFGPWTRKQGVDHVEPPVAVLKHMVTARLHLDLVDADNAPLLIAPGSHRAGRVPAAAIDDLVRRCGTTVCEASRGDVWLYPTLIVHASKQAARPRRRRVLQIDFAAAGLPGDLRWLDLLGPPALENGSPLA